MKLEMKSGNNKDCLFCRFSRDMRDSAYVVWEDKKHIAFLSIYPNTEGVTVVIPKNHHGSYCFDMNDKDFKDLMLAGKKVGKILDKKLKTGRTALVLEGFGIDHAHVKLYPLHGTSSKKWKPIKSDVNKYFKKYEGYVSSHDHSPEDAKKLRKTQKKIIG